MLAYAVAAGEDTTARFGFSESGVERREWRHSFNENVALWKGFRLSTRRFEVISASLTAQGRRSNETQTSFGDWRLTDGLKRISTVYHLGFQGSTGALKGFFIFNFEGILTHKVLRSLSSCCFFHALIYFRETHTARFFLLCDVIRKAGAFMAYVNCVPGKMKLTAFAFLRGVTFRQTSTRFKRRI